MTLNSTLQRVSRRGLRQRGLPGWVGALPLLMFLALFLILPIAANVVTSFWVNGAFSFSAMAQLLEPQYLDAFIQTFNLSLLTAAVGGVLGLLLAWALATGRKPAWLQNLVLSFSAVASQMGGVALAFAFIATLGVQGFATQAILGLTGWDLSQDIQLASFSGLALVYLYFQIPLMAILMLPAFGALKKQWQEAANSLGASRLRYLLDIALPIMWPSIAGSLLLLFANSFGAYATAYALAGGRVNLVPILIGFFISGDVMNDESFAAALVTGMVVVVVAAMGLRSLAERKANRWLR
ncbi:ABC transporter permease subunit [Glutamicibacter protophormiae]|uniref:ABC transporter permease n=1 Tax=Glutamicibacter protophormiae TaxID=37930 RepID=UPI002A83EB79|nr:ABC transporter permease subunit [Glutamicibacter protophormiae]WPR63928.1 ABC transporter permease subunit [Glutamicibacter protophormiae]WPR67423.1 ABC transporter permease subunit [Glutamicibacter protophormiae]